MPLTAVALRRELPDSPSRAVTISGPVWSAVAPLSIPSSFVLSVADINPASEVVTSAMYPGAKTFR